MRSGYITCTYDVQNYGDEALIEMIDHDYIVNHSGMHNTRNGLLGLKRPIDLTYQPQNFLADEFDCHLDDELHNFVTTKGLVSGIYFTMFEFKIEWGMGEDTPNGPAEIESFLHLEEQDTTAISKDQAEIDLFWENFNKGIGND